MKNKKTIDRLFQEKFKNFETEPNKQTWLNIQAALQEEKKERRIIPIWFRYAGIAAAFLLSFFALNTVYKTTTEPKNTIVLDREIVTKPSYSSDSITTKTTKDVKKIYQKNSSQITVTNDDKPKSTRKESDQFSTKTQSKINGSKTKHQNTATVYQKEHNRPLEKTNLAKEAVNSNSPIAEKNALKTPTLTTVILPQKNNQTAEKEQAIVAQINAEKKQFTTLSTPNELERILKEKQDKKESLVVSTQKNKWEITPNVAAMYLNTKSIGSAIDPQLSKNNKTPDNGFSVGIGVNYALNNKIALRTGINAFSVGYNTNDVSYSAGLNTNSLVNVNYTSNQAIEIENQATFNTLTSSEQNLHKTSTGSINQKMGYYEVPFELSYAVVDKKFAVNIIGGISTLFLKENEISLVSAESNLKLGEANNLNPVHFSTNFGLGFKYEFIKSFHLNFEPMIKYQLNSYSNDSNNHNPIFIGLYSGISYRF